MAAGDLQILAEVGLDELWSNFYNKKLSTHKKIC
jgi:hypothetical protein